MIDGSFPRRRILARAHHHHHHHHRKEDTYVQIRTIALIDIETINHLEDTVASGAVLLLFKQTREVR
jgi:hypothetical protein